MIKSPPSLQRYRRADNPEHLPGQISVELPLRAAGDWRDEYVPLGTNVTDLERLARRRIAFVDRLDIWFPTAVLGQEERKRAVRKGRFRIAFVDGGVLPKVELPSTIKPEILLLPGDVVRFERGGAEFFAR